MAINVCREANQKRALHHNFPVRLQPSALIIPMDFAVHVLKAISEMEDNA
jgi:hypothetical protein